MKKLIEEWANNYITETQKVIDVLKYHDVLREDKCKAEGRMQAYLELKKFLETLN